MATNYESTLTDKLYKNVQFWIGDLLRICKEPPKLNASCDENECGLICDKSKQKNDVMSSIKTVTIVGVVVGVRNERNELLNQDILCSTEAQNSNRPIVYDIDDGTGVITAVQFVRKRIISQNLRCFPSTLECLEGSFSKSKDRSLSNPESLALASLIRKTKKGVEKIRNSFKIGTCVEAKGCIQHFQGTAQILAFSIREFSDPNQEMYRYIRLEQLKKHVYPKEFYFGLSNHSQKPKMAK